MLKEIYNFKNGLSKEKKFFGYGNTIINYMDVNKNTCINGDKIKGLVDCNFSEINRFNVKDNDLFFTRTSESSEEIGLASALVNAKENTVFSGFVLRARPITNVNSIYYSYMFKSYNYRKEIIKHSSITTRALTSGTLLGNIQVDVPKIEKQNKIADYLSQIDKLIVIHNEKNNKLISNTKSILSLYNNNLLIHDTIKWKKYNLYSLITEQNNKTTRNNQYEILSSTKENIVSQKEYFNNQIASKVNIGYKIIEKNQLVFSPQNAWMGNININTKYNIGIVSPSYKVYNINENLIDIIYFKKIIKNQYFINIINNNSYEGASVVRKTLDIESFLNEKIDIPPLKYQMKLSNLLSQMDKLIEIEEKKLEKLTEMKKYFLQQFFD